MELSLFIVSLWGLEYCKYLKQELNYFSRIAKENDPKF